MFNHISMPVSLYTISVESCNDSPNGFKRGNPICLVGGFIFKFQGEDFYFQPMSFKFCHAISLTASINS